MKKSLYGILEIPTDASDGQIADAYRTLMEAASTDPDPNRPIVIREAYGILSNAQSRAAYDASLSRRKTPGKPARAGDDGVFDGQTRRWIIWLLIGLSLVAAIYWWHSKKRNPQRVPVAVSQAIAVEPNQEQAESRAAGTPTTTLPAKSPEELYSTLSGSIALISVADSKGNPAKSGSGVVIDSSTVITNCHVTKGGAQIQVKVAGAIHEATVQTADEVFDLCRLRVLGLSASPVSVGSVSSLRTGQKVYAIGAPRGLELTISDGIVSSLRETPTGTYIQTTAPVSPGSSGGGLFNANGQLVGIVTFQHAFGQNLNFAVPADWIDQMRDRAVSAVPAGAENTPNASAPIADRILGTWHCFRPTVGRHMELQFQPGGRIAGTSNGKPYVGNYQVIGKVLNLYGHDNLSLTVEELLDGRMILSEGNAKRIACNR